MAHGIARWSLVTVIVLLVGPAALAQTGPTTTQPVPWSQAARFRMDCGQDVHRFCHGVQPGEGRLIQCLSSHRNELSPACITRVAAAQPTLGVVPPSQNTQSPGLPSAAPSPGHAVTASALRASCGPDVQKLCAGAPRENGGVVKCLSSHRVELSPTCDAFFKEMLARRAAQKGAPKTTPPTANGPATKPAAADTAGDTAAPSAVNGPSDTNAPSAAEGPTDTGAASASDPTDTAAPSITNGQTDTAAPSVTGGPTDTGALPATNGPAATPAANGSADTGAASPAVNGPATTSALPAANAPAATSATSAAKRPPAKNTLDFPL
jgi:hypothetical protein